MVHCMDHTTRAQEQQCFEASMGHQVENGGVVGADALRKEHVAKL